ncbi:hypothetical protein [Streptomyces sp. NPDC087525]|uniref:hypothetical protein n=1 Tax=Streptomyces sp. NPDC087525 TaxID=3365793 RepID=UPI0037F651BC
MTAYTKLRDGLKAALNDGGTARVGRDSTVRGGTELTHKICAFIDEMPGPGFDSPANQMHAACLLGALDTCPDQKHTQFFHTWRVEPGPAASDQGVERAQRYDEADKHPTYWSLFFGSVPDYRNQVYGVCDILDHAIGECAYTATHPRFRALSGYVMETIRQNPGKVHDAPSNWIKQYALANYNEYAPRMRQAITPTYAWVLGNKYDPVTSALRVVLAEDGGAAARAALKEAIKSGRFTAVVGAVMPDDPDHHVLWFLYNLWLFLTLLNEPSVDKAINECKQAGLPVPAQVGPMDWNHYVDWAVFGPPFIFQAAKEALSAPSMKVRCFTPGSGVGGPVRQSTYSHCYVFGYELQGWPAHSIPPADHDQSTFDCNG